MAEKGGDTEPKQDYKKGKKESVELLVCYTVQEFITKRSKRQEAMQKVCGKQRWTGVLRC
jgi:hypothetical protein